MIVLLKRWVLSLPVFLLLMPLLFSKLAVCQPVHPVKKVLLKWDDPLIPEDLVDSIVSFTGDYYPVMSKPSFLTRLVGGDVTFQTQIKKYQKLVNYRERDFLDIFADETTEASETGKEPLYTHALISVIEQKLMQFLQQKEAGFTGYSL